MGNSTRELLRRKLGFDGKVVLSLTLIQSLFLDDPVMRTAQRNTLTTLLDHVSPTGQLPSNVRIDTGRPDYSGVGRIASIDSGLWVIIALYNYVHATGDLELVERYRTQLERAMLWLGAQDSNADGLLEIPEAGDWTDLFGHSYNVLYDETLWYRANVCYGKLLEMLKEHARAADYFRARPSSSCGASASTSPTRSRTSTRP